MIWRLFHFQRKNTIFTLILTVAFKHSKISSKSPNLQSAPSLIPCSKAPICDRLLLRFPVQFPNCTAAGAYYCCSYSGLVCCSVLPPMRVLLQMPAWFCCFRAVTSCYYLLICTFNQDAAEADLLADLHVDLLVFVAFVVNKCAAEANQIWVMT